MPTYARKNLLAESLVYHVYNRSNAKAVIFKCEEDYLRFMDILHRYVLEFCLYIYHWVIMPTHYHLLLEIKEPLLLSKAIGGIALAYTQYYHKKYDSCGYLWQGRFQSRPVQKENYMIKCGRYIERNPVKAGMVAVAYRYPYSSAAYYCLGNPDGITREDGWYTGLATGGAEKQDRYKAFLQTVGSDDNIDWENMKIPCGDAEFAKRFIKNNGRLVPYRVRRRKLALQNID